MSDLCRWCRQMIMPDGHGNWVHTTREYTCRDRWRVHMSTSAAPLPGAHWAGLYRSGWTVRSGEDAK
jgi:hypothetical protein